MNKVYKEFSHAMTILFERYDKKHTGQNTPGQPALLQLQLKATHSRVWLLGHRG